LAIPEHAQMIHDFGLGFVPLLAFSLGQALEFQIRTLPSLAGTGETVQCEASIPIHSGNVG
jgi:hypothetical protein